MNSLATPALYDADRRHAGPDRRRPELQRQRRQRHRSAPAAWPPTTPTRPATTTTTRRTGSARNLIPGATGSDVPLFLTQGLTENNTVADGTAQYLQNHTGYERAWLGPWEHVRGNETDESGRLKMGRAGWFDEVMRFYDRFLKGADADGRRPADRGPDQRRHVARRGSSWPPADSTALHDAAARRHLHRRRHRQRDRRRRRRRASGRSRRRCRTTSTWRAPGSATVDVSTHAAATPTSCVDVYDLDASGTGPLITRQGHLIRTQRPDRRSTSGRRTGRSRPATASACA